MYASSNLSFATGVFNITPSAAKLPRTARGIRCNVAGTVTFQAMDGTQATMDVAAGEILPIEIIKVTQGPDGLVGFA